jgi:hypothetical protein
VDAVSPFVHFFLTLWMLAATPFLVLAPLILLVHLGGSC